MSLTNIFVGFVVGSTVSDTSNNGALPATLRSVDFPPSKTGVDRTFNFQRNGAGWVINGVGWNSGPEARIIAKPPRGKVEVWDLVGGNGPWTHPVHMHMVDFQILSRTGGRGAVTAAEKAALKDTVWLARGETVRVIARFAPWDGLCKYRQQTPLTRDTS